MLRVFIADESQAVRERLAAMVTEVEGVELVGQAGNALAAIEGIYQLRPEIAILDIRMPAGNNIQAIKAVKAMVPGTQIIMLATFPYPQYHQKCLEAGADYFFDKTSEFDQVIELLRKFCQSDAIYPPIRLLIIADEHRDSLLLREYLRKSIAPRFTTALTNELVDGLELLEEQSFDAILLDLGLPGSHGKNTLTALLAKARATPVLTLTDAEDKTLALEMTRLGAQDNLVKNQLNELSLTSILRFVIERRRAEKMLREERDQSQQYLTITEAVFVALNPQGNITSINRKASNLLGYAEQELMGKNWFETCLPKRFHDPVKTTFHQIMAGEISSSEFGKNPILTRSGEERWISWHNALLRDGLGNIVGTLSSGEDITELKQDEARIKHLNQILRTVRDINQLILQKPESQVLLDRACEILQRDCGFVMVWIGKISTGHEQVIPAARAGKGTDYLNHVTITWDDSETGRGPTGTALRTMQPCICRDILNDPCFKPWRAAALERGYASSAAFPIQQGQRVLGALNVYSDQENAFTDEEAGLLTELAGDLAFAL